MPLLEFSDLPGDARVKLSEEGEKELWHRIDEFGGVKTLSNAFDYANSKIYNWKSKDVAMPVNFVRQIMGGNNSDGVVLVKGGSTGSGFRNPEFPVDVPEELLTRIDLSVKTNREGTPTYITGERALAERFEQLLSELGTMEIRVYERGSRFELRYPKFVHSLLSGMTFETDFAAAVEEQGSIEDGVLKALGTSIDVEEFESRFYSREKRFELALERGESEMIAEMMAEEADKVGRLFRNQ